jgi:Kdo2-lipid IVA lauroyltransferase/acyltransferase
MNFLFRILSRCPLWLLHVLGSGVGWLSYGLSADYRARFKAHSQRARITPKAQREAIQQAGRMVMELPALWLQNADQPLTSRVRIVGVEHVKVAHEKAQGMVFLTPHLGCFEICAQAYAHQLSAQFSPVTVLFRPARQAWLRKLMSHARERPGLKTAPASLKGVRDMIRALRKGEAIGLLPDQVPPEGMGVWAPFFGQSAYTMTLATRLIQQTGAQPLLIWGERLPRGAGFVVRIEPLLTALPPNPEAAAQVINQAMEGLILKCPQQYLWGYHRYKNPKIMRVD